MIIVANVSVPACACSRDFLCRIFPHNHVGKTPLTLQADGGADRGEAARFADVAQAALKTCGVAFKHGLRQIGIGRRRISASKIDVTTIRRLLRDTSGATAIEYCLIAGSVAIAIVSGVSLIGTKLKFWFMQIAAVN